LRNPKTGFAELVEALFFLRVRKEEVAFDKLRQAG